MILREDKQKMKSKYGKETEASNNLWWGKAINDERRKGTLFKFEGRSDREGKKGKERGE